MIVLFTLVERQPNNINPYNYMAETYANGLDPIVAAIVAATGGDNPTTDQLNTAIMNYIAPLYYGGTPPLDQNQKLNAVLGNFYNSFIQPQQSAQQFYSKAQLAFIASIMMGIERLDVNQLASQNFWQVSEENLAISNITAQQQAPIYMALAIAEAAYGYFYDEILGPDSDWSNYLDSNPAVNFINLNSWIKAIFRGTLIGYTQSTVLVPTTSADAAGIGNNLITATMGGLTATFGKIILQWIKRPGLINAGRWSL